MAINCILCAIVNDEIPSYKLYEDDLFLVILDRFPKCVGHTLILPKTHAASLFDLSEAHAKALMPLAQKIARTLREILPYDGLNLLQNNGEAAGQQINHFHLHLIPRFKNDAMIMQYEPKDPANDEFENFRTRFLEAWKSESER